MAYPLALAFVTSRRRLHDIIHHPPPMMIHRGRFWRKAIVTAIAAIGFVSLYEVTILDSQYVGAAGDAARESALAARQARGSRSAPPPTAKACHGLGRPRPERRRRGRSGTAAGRIGDRDRFAAPKYNGIYTVMDTGPSIQGRQIDVYMWNCNEALRVRPPAGSPDRAAPRLESAGDDAELSRSVLQTASSRPTSCRPDPYRRPVPLRERRLGFTT